MKKKKEYAVISKLMTSRVDNIGEMKELIKRVENSIKKSQKILVNFIKKHKLQDRTIKGELFVGNFMSQQNERISKTTLKGMLSDRLIEMCTVRSKKYEWVKTSRIKASRKK